jgi:hypothetical protein
MQSRGMSLRKIMEQVRTGTKKAMSESSWAYLMTASRVRQLQRMQIKVARSLSTTGASEAQLLIPITGNGAVLLLQLR